MAVNNSLAKRQKGGTDYCDTEAEAIKAWNRRDNNG